MSTNDKAETADDLPGGQPHSSPAGDGIVNQPDIIVIPDQPQDEDIIPLLSPGPNFFIDQFEWAEDNLPIGFSFNSSRIATPEFLAGWTWEPQQPAQRPKEEGDENDIVITHSRGVEYIAELVDPKEDTTNNAGARHSSRLRIGPRPPFLNQRPVWAMLATDFKTISAIPRDVPIWCPCCARVLLKLAFRKTFMDQIPVETCISCRKGRTTVPGGFLICWSAPPEYNGCGRLLPKGHLSSFYDPETFTGIFCHDCRAFGHGRARLEGRYVEKAAGEGEEIDADAQVG
ncbi:hypothetical protein GGR54DRAFT_653045 [Hypoxylon sp. NC1633]|nr:hypothetical protein GGR54DRAFT_653045 [Hypoxylon sp. NC1633]